MVSEGMTIYRAARTVGIAYSTVHRALKTGKVSEPEDFLCVKCGAVTWRGHSSKYCQQCDLIVEKINLWAMGRVANAVKAGKLPPVRTLTCVDCGAPAVGYDHRDYSKPLDVQPVCRRCNWKRGPANF